MKILLACIFHICVILPVSMGLLDQMYCGSDTPLDTPYFIPFHKTAQPALGCASQVQDDDKTEVHVVRLRKADREVFLHVSGPLTHKLALVLASGHPVTWHLSVSGFSSAADILVSDGSSVVDIRTGHQIQSSPAILSSPNLTTKLARAKFSHINTFTTIEMANRIFINLPPEISTTTCALTSEARSLAVSAYYMERQSTYGCYHPEAAGLLPNDVHVIDLRTHSRLMKRSDSSTDPDSAMSEVVVDLVPDLTGDDPLPRNLTLILKSDNPVRWLLKSHGIQGQLVVAAGANPVENLSVGSSQQLDIQKTEIPDQFERLMKEVTHQYGIPLSYMRVHQANLLEMVIPPRSKRELSNLWDRNRPAYNRDLAGSPQTAYSEPEELEDQIYTAAEAIENVMEKTCDEKKKEVSVHVPEDIIVKYGIGSITLNDASCEAEKNASHWVLKSHSTACGSTALTYGAAPMYRNNLNIHFTQGYLAGQRTKIPFICKFKPGIPGITVNDYEDEEEVDVDYNLKAEEPDLSGEEMYSLTVQLVSEDGDTRATLMEKKSDSATAAIGDKIYVSSHINAVPFLALAIEQCWLSNTSYVTSHATPRDEMLISTGCPAKKGVSLHWDKGSSNSAFSFKINQQFLSQSKVWIQCRMGLCSATNAGATGNIRRCVDPKSDCEDKTLPHKESSVQQITVRGPLHIIPVTRDTLGHSPVAHAERTDQQGPEQHSYNTQTSHTLVEVPVEVAVAIALASFIVGAMSTGVLWFLHSRAMRAKSRRLRTGGLPAVEGTELQSMIGFTSSSPHCRQTTLPPSGTGDHNGNVNCVTCPLVTS